MDQVRSAYPRPRSGGGGGGYGRRAGQESPYNGNGDGDGDNMFSSRASSARRGGGDYGGPNLADMEGHLRALERICSRSNQHDFPACLRDLTEQTASLQHNQNVTDKKLHGLQQTFAQQMAMVLMEVNGG